MSSIFNLLKILESLNLTTYNFKKIDFIPLQDISALGIVDLSGYTIDSAPEIKKKKSVHTFLRFGLPYEVDVERE